MWRRSPFCTSDTCGNGICFLPAGEALHLSARHYGNVGRFFNHDGAGLQNADLVRCSHDGLLRVFVVATRDIPKGDQILVDYGVAYWRDSPETLRRLSQAGE